MGKAPALTEYLFSGASWCRSNVTPASRRQIGHSRIVSSCRQDAGSTLNKYLPEESVLFPLGFYLGLRETLSPPGGEREVRGPFAKVHGPNAWSDDQRGYCQNILEKQRFPAFKV